MTDGIRFRSASRDDLQTIVKLLADDELGTERESLDQHDYSQYEKAFEAILGDPNPLFAVAIMGAEIVGCMQLSFVPGLSHQGSWRGQIESVRTASSHRGQGIGRAFFQWAFQQFRERGCGLVQLTSDKRRAESIGFYESLGFRATHEGMKLTLQLSRDE
jgi:ribosomal protein S18 acetylase RimI-like enzyme